MTNITLTKIQIKLLSNIARQTTSSQRLVFRANIILKYAEANDKQVTADKCNTSRAAVYRWTGRWRECQADADRFDSEYAAGHLSLRQHQAELGNLLNDAPRPVIQLHSLKIRNNRLLLWRLRSQKQLVYQ